MQRRYGLDMDNLGADHASVAAAMAKAEPDRRQELAASLEGLSDREAVRARLSADQDQATPPTAAVAQASGRSPKARKTHGASRQARLRQKGISR